MPADTVLWYTITLLSKVMRFNWRPALLSCCKMGKARAEEANGEKGSQCNGFTEKVMTLLF